MSWLQWWTKHRFNHIDGIGIGAIWMCISHGRFLVAVAIFFGTALVSGALEAFAKQRPERKEQSNG